LNADWALATKDKKGGIVVAVWNYAPPEKPGTTRNFTLRFKGVEAKQAMVSIADPEHGDVHSAYETMDAPRYPTAAQIQKLREASNLPAAETRALSNAELNLSLPSYGLAVVRLK
jgi:xylan 1,4-beta-xylosidase